jgi:hypothetical protein
MTLKVGCRLPPSSRAMNVLSKPAAAASCSCVSPAAARALRNVAAKAAMRPSLRAPPIPPLFGRVDYGQPTIVYTAACWRQTLQTERAISHFLSPHIEGRRTILTAIPSDKPYEELLWADIRDLRKPAGVEARGVRFFTTVEFLRGTLFIMEGIHSEASFDGVSVPKMRSFVAATFDIIMRQCADWQLQQPSLYVFVRVEPAIPSRPVFDKVIEVYGEDRRGALVLKLEGGTSIVVGRKGLTTATLLRRLFPPE